MKLFLLLTSAIAVVLPISNFRVKTTFSEDMLSLISTGVEFPLKFEVDFPKRNTEPYKHWLTPLNIGPRPDVFSMNIDLVDSNHYQVRRLFYTSGYAKDKTFDVGAEFILPSTLPPGKYKIHIQFQNLDSLASLWSSAKTDYYSKQFEIKKGPNVYDEYFKKNGEGDGDIMVSLYYQVWNEIGGPKRQLIAQTFSGTVISTARA